LDKSEGSWIIQQGQKKDRRIEGSIFLSFEPYSVVFLRKVTCASLPLRKEVPALIFEGRGKTKNWQRELGCIFIVAKSEKSKGV
jgi:hypothetical protein